MVTTAYAQAPAWTAETPWTPEDRVFEFMGLVRGHTAKHWGTRATAVTDVDDLAAMALESLIHIAYAFDGIAARHDDPAASTSRTLFWGIVKTAIRHDLTKWFERREQPAPSLDDHDDTYDEHPDAARTALFRYVPASLLHRTIADATARLDPKVQLILALRYYEELELTEVATILDLGHSTVQAVITSAVGFVLHEALSEVMDNAPAPTEQRVPAADIAQSAHRWVLERYDAGVPAYLAYVHRHYRADVSYVVDLLDRAHGARKRYDMQAVDEDCSVDDCTRRAYRRGLCSVHYERTRATTGEPCSVDGCTADRRSLGMCNRHYQQHRRRASWTD